LQVRRTPLFDRSAKRLGLAEAELSALAAEIERNPDAGQVIRGLGGARKLRFGLGGKGKRGGGRAIYILVRVRDAAVLLFAYAKADQADLSNQQREALRALIEEIANEV
jgi:hypothetical protein